LGEIESVLLENSIVSQAVVLSKEDSQGNNHLVSYVVPNGILDREALVLHLRRRLPEYMVPALWVEMENLPLTANGKVDVKALPSPSAHDVLVKKYVGPRNELDKKLITIWEDLLHVEQIGIEDNFFDLGGHSLLAMRIVAHIESAFQISIPIAVLFKLTTIKELSQYLDTQILINTPEKNSTSYELLDV
jgi:acyl carrier protein